MDTPVPNASNARRIGFARRMTQYLASACAASLVYFVWVALWITLIGPPSERADVVFAFTFALGFGVFSGFLATMFALILPWAAAVRIQAITRWDARVFFPVVGALLVFVLGCAATSLSPKLLIVEDQTFLEGALITAQRQGLCLAVCGLVFGACYAWLDRRRSSLSTRTGTAHNRL